MTDCRVSSLGCLGGRVCNRDGLRGGVSVGVEEEADNAVERKGV